MEEASCPTVLEGKLTGIKFGLASHQEICKASMMGCPIGHASQLASNPFLGLPLEIGKCESCGTAEPGKCEGHFGYIDLKIPIYHPNHVSELKRMLSLVCLKCLKMKKSKFPTKNAGLAERLLSLCCEDAAQVSIGETKPTDGACSLELKLPSNKKPPPGFWNFLRYGYAYGDGVKRTLLPLEVKQILKRIPEDTRKKLAAKGFNPQDGYILQYLPVPPNCLSVPEISDGVTVMSADPSISMLKKVIRQVELIASSRSGMPNFESAEVEANELQAVVEQYLQVRGTGKASRDNDARFGASKELNNSSTKAWLEKMRTLFIRKGSGFSSRTVITGDAYRRVNEVGIPHEIARRITFEEKVNIHNIGHLQKLVDEKLCLTYTDGSATYSLREGSKGHTFLKPGHVVHRRIMDGDYVFVNRPPTTHKHSLQALQVYVHDDNVVKINPLICGPLGADFDGDCIHLFYPQSLAAKAEVLELFSVEKQLLSSHSGKPNLQLASDSLLSLKMMFKKYFFNKPEIQQLAMYVSNSLPQPALLKANSAAPCWTALQILETTLPNDFNCSGERHLVSASEVLKIDCDRRLVPALVNEIGTSVFFDKSAEDVLKFFDSVQPLLMENLFSEGFSVSLEDFSISGELIQEVQKGIRFISPLLYHLRATYNPLVEMQLESHIRSVKESLSSFISKSSALGDLVDSKSDSAMTKIAQQVGFLGRQLFDKGKFYSNTLVEDVTSLYQSKYPSECVDYPSAEYGLVQSCFFHGLDPYEEIVHSIATREVIVRSSRGLTEPGTLFKNLMAILRDVVICYDGTVRNVCSNSIIQFEYGFKNGSSPQSLFPAGEPVGVLAATAMSNPAYKAVLDSTPSSNSSWELMKEILLCKVNCRNELIDRRVILYLNDCGCGRKYCKERAAYMVKNQLKKVSLKDTAVEFMIEYQNHRAAGSLEIDSGLVGHVHLNEMLLQELNLGMDEILKKCQDTMNSFKRRKAGKKMNIGDIFKRTVLSSSECCSFHQCSDENTSGSPCLMFFYQDFNNSELEAISQVLADFICPVLLETVIKGDPRISSANIIWIDPDSTTWVRSPNKSQKGQLALDVVLEKSVVKQSGDAWRIVLDCCLSVLHLIDTRRSIPYAIKQVQELFGVACAFDQAVQRLATAVGMVTKGVLKEHLLLLANSMTCAGNFVGFNSGGIKALSRALNLQVPFTEATLFTPKKCFEKAAEKCHVDSLSSIVGSCSWGKHVAVGTGSRFEILWDTKESELKQEGGIDVFNFLHMVNSANGADPTTAALGAEIDDLLLEDEYDDLALSPEPNSGFDKPVFEDIVEFQGNSDNIPGISNWDSSLNTASNVGKDWSKNVDAEVVPETWSGWGTKKVDIETQGDSRDQEPSAWGKHPTPAWGVSNAEPIDGPSKNVHGSKINCWDSFSSKGTYSEKEPAGSAWVKKDEDPAVSHSWGQNKCPETSQASWGQKNAADNPQGPWEQKKAAETSHGPWEKKAADICQGSWGQLKSADTSQVSWGTQKAADTSQGQWEQKKAAETSQGPWEKKTADNCQGSWGQQKSAETAQISWGQQKASDTSQGPWEQKSAVRSQVSWGQQKPPENSQASLSQKKPADTAEGSWGQQKPADASETCWGQLKPADTSEGSWGQQKPADASESCWGQLKTADASEGSWGKKKPVDNSQSSWGQQKSAEMTQVSWGQQKSPENSQTSGGQQKTSDTAGGSWGHHGDQSKKRPWGPNTGQWKGNNGRSGKGNDDSSVVALLTATRQRLDVFTSEEQPVLSHIDPILLSLRRIMFGCKDGDPLSAEDQTYIHDNVFSFHPDKAVKMGSGIDHFTVKPHGNFKGTRCLFVVSTDGREEDFSYRKCLQNLIKEKYPEVADSFISKYFKTPRAGGNQ